MVRAQNWGLMQHGVVVWLRGEPELLARRALRDGIASRPMLAGAGGAGGGEEVGALVACLPNQAAFPASGHNMIRPATTYARRAAAQRR